MGGGGAEDGEGQKAQRSWIARDRRSLRVQPPSEASKAPSGGIVESPSGPLAPLAPAPRSVLSSWSETVGRGRGEGESAEPALDRRSASSLAATLARTWLARRANPRGGSAERGTPCGQVIGRRASIRSPRASSRDGAVRDAARATDLVLAWRPPASRRPSNPALAARRPRSRGGWGGGGRRGRGLPLVPRRVWRGRLCCPSPLPYPRPHPRPAPPRSPARQSRPPPPSR